MDDVFNDLVADFAFLCQQALSVKWLSKSYWTAARYRATIAHHGRGRSRDINMGTVAAVQAV